MSDEFQTISILSIAIDVIEENFGDMVTSHNLLKIAQAIRSKIKEETQGTVDILPLLDWDQFGHISIRDIIIYH